MYPPVQWLFANSDFFWVCLLPETQEFWRLRIYTHPPFLSGQERLKQISLALWWAGLFLGRLASGSHVTRCLCYQWEFLKRRVKWGFQCICFLFEGIDLSSFFPVTLFTNSLGELRGCWKDDKYNPKKKWIEKTGLLSHGERGNQARHK